MASGNLKWYDPEKGYGFIAQAGGGRDVFLHASIVTAAGIPANKLDRGAALDFDLEEGAKGLKAAKVRLVA